MGMVSILQQSHSRRLKSFKLSVTFNAFETSVIIIANEITIAIIAK